MRVAVTFLIMLDSRHIAAAAVLSCALIAASLVAALACGVCTDSCHSEITAASSSTVTVTLLAAAALAVTVGGQAWSHAGDRRVLLVGVDASPGSAHRPLRI